MAKIPTITSVGLPGVNQSLSLSPDMFGARQARQVGQVADIAQNIDTGLQKRKQKADASAVFEADTTITRSAIEKQAEFRQRKGLRAQGLVEDASAWEKDLLDNVLPTAENDTQRRLIEQQIKKHSTRMLSFANGYQEQQLQVGHDAAWQAKKSANRNLAIDTDNEQDQDAIISEIARANEYMATERGLGADWADEQTQKDLAIIHRTKMDMLREEDPQMALQYLNRYREDLDPETEATYEDDIKRRVTENASIQVADTLFGAGIDYDEAIEEINSTYADDPKTREIVINAVNKQYAQGEKARNAGWRDAKNDIISNIVENDLSTAGITDTMLDEASPSDQLHFRKLIEAERKNAIERRQFGERTDFPTYELLVEEIERGNIKTPDEIDVWGPLLKESDVRGLRKQVINAGKVEVNDVRSAYSLMLPYKRQNHKKWGDDQKEDFMRFHAWASEQVTESHRPQDLEKMAAEWFTSGSGLQDEFFRDDPNKFGEAIRAKRDDFIPETVDSTVLNAANELFGDEFTISAEDYFGAERMVEANGGVELSPEVLAAYSALRAHNKPLTPANVDRFIQNNFR